MKYYQNNGLLNEILITVNQPTEYSKDVAVCFQKVICFSRGLQEHSLNVAFLSMLLGMRFLESNKELQELYIASLLHDYGKMYISRSILDKADQLTTEEKKTMDLHSIVGAFYLSHQTNFNEKILTAVQDHHEKLDGSGYGLHKKNKNISGYAKIITIADVYDAMVSDRAYRKGLLREEAVNYLCSNTNRYFVQSYVEQFVSVTDNLDLSYFERKFRDNLMILQPQFI